MQKIFSFTTIFQGVDVIFQKDRDIISIKNFESKKQSEILIKSIESIFEEYNIDYDNIDVFSSIVGPGNFTGIKTSLAVIKAISVALNKNIVLVNVFDIISHNIDKYNIILLDMNTAKYFIRDRNGDYLTIYKKDVNEFLKINVNLKILTNDLNIVGDNIIHASFSMEKWADLVYSKVQKGLFSNNIEPLYIEDALITERKK